jgi:hypothetical protein
MIERNEADLGETTLSAYRQNRMLVITSIQRFRSMSQSQPPVLTFVQTKII